ncbi:MAG TPA: serine protease [Vicinamibacterales bacterium]|nr:serine protease [Vicinamibacterales bacterium]
MANEKYGSTTLEQTGAGGVGVDEEDLSSGAAVQRAVPRPAPRPPRVQARAGALTPSESQHAFGEVAGDAVAQAPSRPQESAVEAAASHEEVASAEAAESGEESIEATPEQIRAAMESGEETALSDLRSGAESYEATEFGEEGAAAVSKPLLDAGEAGEEAEQEFFPILAALAPTLISSVGPAIAKGVMSRLSPRAKQAVKRIPTPVVSAATAAGKAALTSASGRSNLLGLIAKLLQQAQAKESFEAATEAVDETFVEEAARAMEVILGTDDRVRITNTTNIPWRRVCALRITFPSGSTYRGTGFLIGPRAVATAGHCVFLHDQGGWARRVEVIPGANGTSRPYGQVESSTLRSVAGWVNGKKPESDYGCIVLPSGAFGGRALGSFGCANFDAAKIVAQPSVLGGYPGDKSFAELWGMSRVIKTVTAKTMIYDIDTMGGQSGAPVYIMRAGQRYVIGIHNYGNASGNSATRVTEPVYQRLLAWSKL